MPDLGQSGASHWQFIGGTIYCPVKPGRLNLGPNHRYGRSFICPHCGEFVRGRLDDNEHIRRLVDENRDILDRLAEGGD